MKHLQLAILLLFICSFCGLKAQQNHFIYIETENKQAFYVKLDKKLYASSPWGYLVMPKQLMKMQFVKILFGSEFLML